MEANELLVQLNAELKAFTDRSQEEKKTFGTVQQETKTAIDGLMKRLDDLEVKLTSPSMSSDGPSLEKELRENESLARLMKDRRGTARIELSHKSAVELLEVKTTVTTSAVGFPTSGVMPEERGRFVEEARRPLRMRDVIPSRATAFGQVYWPKVNHPMTKASPQTEASDKPETLETFTVVSENVRTLALLIPASKQVLQDWSELLGILRSSLGYQVDKEEDRQILFGDGTGINYNGLTTQATAFDLTLATASDGYEYLDIIGLAAQQVAEADEVSPSFAVVHPGDWWKIRRGKDSTGRYILGDPQSPVDPTLWGLRVIPTTAMTKGYFLVGNGTSVGAEIRDRTGLEIELSTEHSDFFIKNLVMIRAEKRGLIACYRPAAFIYGALVQSPS